MVGVFYIVVLPPPFQVFFVVFLYTVIMLNVIFWVLVGIFSLYYDYCVCKIDEEEPKKNYCIVEKGKGGMSRSN